MKLSVVTTLYYSAPYIQEFYQRIKKELSQITPQYEIIFVNDGSPDNVVEKALELQQQDENIILIDLARNFGHHKAMMTGLQYTSGDFVFLIDVDLEEPPELLTLFWAEMQSKPQYDVAYGVQKQRKGGWFERISGKIFYKMLNALAYINYPPNTLVARLMTKRYVEAVKKYPEKELELWGIFSLVGFEQQPIYVNKGSKGTTTYTLTKKIRLAIEDITSFSNRPLYFIFALGINMTIFAVIYIIWVLIQKYFFEVSIDGWTSLIISIWLVGGITTFSMGILGIYLSKIFAEIKNRPLAIIKHIHFSPKYQSNESNQ